MRYVVGLALLLALASPVAIAKEGAARTLVICGADDCRTDRGEAWRQASTLATRSQRPPLRGGAFYDVAFLDERGVPTSAAWRYVPKLDATRAPRPGGPRWFRERPALVRELEKLAAGLAPRPASALGDAPGWPVAYQVPATESIDEEPGVAWQWLAFTGLVLLLIGAVARTRRRPRMV
jgi:hypothetical protein